MIQSNIKLQGEPSAQALASGLATLGRYGDNYMVHAAEGETFVPKEILDANPALKTELFDQMRSMGIENPNRYVVGDALNSINPVTGQPEFFFKKIFRAVKKVFKKVLPVAAPIIGNLIAPGIGGIIASGLTTKLQGGSWADALKSAGLAYAGGAAMRGLQGGIGTLGNPNASFFGGFGEGLQSGLTEPFSAAKGLFASGSQNTLSQGIFGGLGSASGSLMSGSYFDPTTASGAEKGFMDYLAPKYDPTGGVQNVTKDFVTISQNKSPAVLSPEGEVRKAINMDTAVNPEASAKNLNTPSSKIARTSIPTQDLLNLQEGFTTPRPVALPNKVPVDNFTLDLKADPFRTGAGILPTAEQNLMTSIDAELNPPTFMDKFKKFGSKIPEKLVSKEVLGPVLAATVPAGIAYLAADEPTEDQKEGFTDPQKTAYSQYLSGKSSDPNFAQTPEGQRLRSIFMGPAPRTAEQLSRSTGVSLADAQRYLNRKYGVKPLSGIQLASVNNQASPIQLGGAMPPGLMAAAGGEIKGPGSGTSDSIPAMLSDGEFVMTAQAVRNAGNGNRDLGAARMYDMMNKFERAV